MTASSHSGAPATGALNVRMSHSPQHTVYLRLSAAVARPRTDPDRRPVVTSAEQAVALRPLQASGAKGYVPDAMVPIADHPDVAMGDQLAALHDYSERHLVDDLTFIGKHTRAWDTVARDPRRWLRAYAETIRACWERLEPGWNSAQHLIDREVERIGIASVRGGLEAALNMLSPRLGFAEDRFTFAGHCDISLRGRRLILAPSLVAPGSVLVHDADPTAVTIAYPVPGQGSPPGPATGDQDRLALVIGSRRAAILRRLRTSMTMGAIARSLNVTPAAATRHCDHLERAGLIVRERCGQSVRVSASSSGRALRDLLS